MKKSERIIRNVCICGIVSYLVYCFYLCVKDRVHSAPWDYLGRGYRSEFGVVLILSLLGIIYIAVSNRIRNRKTIGLKPISKAYIISFIVSYIPYVILLAYSLYCSKYGFEFFRKVLWLASFLRRIYYNGTGILCNSCISVLYLLADTLHR